MSEEMNKTFPHFHLLNKVKIVAGDPPYQPGDYQLKDNKLVHDIEKHLTQPNKGEELPLNAMKSVTIQTEDTFKKLPEAAVWAVAVGAVFGPIGAIAGFILGGFGHSVCCLVEMDDGKKFLAVCTDHIYKQLLSLSSL